MYGVVMANDFYVSGEMLIRTENGVIPEPFKDVKITLNEGLTNQEALSVIRGGMLPSVLADEHKGFKRVRTCEITKSTPSAGKAEQSEFDALYEKAVKLNCIPSGLDQYKTEKGKVKALNRAIALIEGKESK